MVQQLPSDSRAPSSPVDAEPANLEPTLKHEQADEADDCVLLVRDEHSLVPEIDRDGFRSGGCVEPLGQAFYQGHDRLDIGRSHGANRNHCVAPNVLPLSRERRSPCYRLRPSRARRSAAGAAC